MTHQAPELLEIDGRELPLYTTPLIPQHPRIVVAEPENRSTALHRGYLGRWRIAGGRLFLVGLEQGYRMAGLRPIFADWVSGRLIAAAPEANRSLKIRVKRGRVLAVETLELGPWELERRALQLQVYAMLLLLLLPPALVIAALFLP